MFTILKYVNLRKAYNFLLILVSYSVSILLRKVVIWGNPYSLTTEPTNLCNLSCPECPTGNKTSHVKKGKMAFEVYKKIIDDVKPFVIYQMLYFQGEPFLHPELYEMIRYADDRGIYTSLSTNGHFLSKENVEKLIRSGLKKIIISLDGITQETYEKYRIGGKLDSVLKGIKTLAEFKKQQRTKYPKIVIQFLVLKHNEGEISDVKPFCKKLGANRVEFKSAQISHPENSQLIPSNKKFARYVQHNTRIKIKNKLKNRCFRIWSTLLITWEGHVNPCCFDKYNQHTIGTISNKNTLQVWKSLSFNQFRLRVLENRKQTPMCCNCTEGLKLN